MSIVFLLLWIVIAFVALRFIGQRFFTGSNRAEVFAGVAVLAFFAGAFSPFSGRHDPATTVTGSPPPSAPVASAPQAIKDVSSTCRAVNRHAGKALGSMDVVGELQNGQPVTLANGFTASPNGKLYVIGWGATANKTVARAACLVIDGTVRHDAEALYGSSRPDVAAAFKTDAMTNTGYNVTLPYKALKPGKHAIDIAIVTPSGVSTFNSKAFFIVK